MPDFVIDSHYDLVASDFLDEDEISWLLSCSGAGEGSFLPEIDSD